MDGGRRRRLQRDAGGGDYDAVFVGDDDGRRIRLGNGARDQSEGEEEGAHAVKRYSTVGCGAAGVGFEIPFRGSDGEKCSFSGLSESAGIQER